MCETINSLQEKINGCISDRNEYKIRIGQIERVIKKINYELDKEREDINVSNKNVLNSLPNGIINIKIDDLIDNISDMKESYSLNSDNNVSSAVNSLRSEIRACKGEISSLDNSIAGYRSQQDEIRRQQAEIRLEERKAKYNGGHYSMSQR